MEIYGTHELYVNLRSLVDTPATEMIPVLRCFTSTWMNG